MSHGIVIIGLVANLAVLVGCESLSGGSSGGGAKVAESGTAKGSAGGFSATMSAELARAGIGEPTITAPPAAPAAASGSAVTRSDVPASGSAASGSAASGSAPASGSAAAQTGSVTSGTAPSAGSGMASAPPQVAALPVTNAGPPEAGSAVTPPAPTAKVASTAKAVGAVKAPASRAYAKPSADVAAIKLDLEPNWERDMGEAATFSLVVKLPGTEDTRMFSVRYGYEDPSAPNDCDQYRKFLEDKGLMKVTLNRQRGAACYLEGTDQGGVVAYRFLLLYGGKKLMCHGSLYKDAASAALGDLRDKVLLQAKKICETLAL